MSALAMVTDAIVKARVESSTRGPASPTTARVTGAEVSLRMGSRTRGAAATLNTAIVETQITTLLLTPTNITTRRPLKSKTISQLVVRAKTTTSSRTTRTR